MNSMKKQVLIAFLIALSIVISICESYIPAIVPGFKLGLCNVVILFIIYKYSIKDAIVVSLIRIFIVAILRTGLFSFSFFFSLSGSISSLCIMYLMKKFTKLSIIGVSLLGAIFHSIGQIIMSILLFNNTNFLYLLPILIILSTFTGIVVGLVCKRLIIIYDDTNNRL